MTQKKYSHDGENYFDAIDDCIDSFIDNGGEWGEHEFYLNKTTIKVRIYCTNRDYLNNNRFNFEILEK